MRKSSPFHKRTLRRHNSPASATDVVRAESPEPVIPI